jgi:hypothetical protein
MFLVCFDVGQKRYIAIEIHKRRLGLTNSTFECNTRFSIPEEGENDALAFRPFSSISV